MLKPIIKWVGGKRKLAARIAATMPAQIETFCEPFCGGAAVFVELYNQGRVKKTILNDKNKALMDLYGAVKADPDKLIAELRELDTLYREGNKEALYYNMRTLWNSGEATPAAFVFLKQTSFNGLWRLNKKGGMNAPWGKYENPPILNEENIRAWHTALQDVTLSSVDALDCMAGADAVYFDPPYVGTFTSYTAEGFTNANQVDVIKVADDLAAKGVWAGVSNSLAAKPLFDAYWPTGTQVEYMASDTVSCNTEGRARRAELFVHSK